VVGLSSTCAPVVFKYVGLDRWTGAGYMLYNPFLYTQLAAIASLASSANAMSVMSTLDGVSHWRLTLAALSLAFATYVASCVYTALTSPLRSIPGPWMSRFTNRQLKSAVTGGKRIFYIDELHKKYGPVVRISPDEVAVFDIEAFRQIHAVSGGYTKGDFYTKLTNFPVHSVFTLRDSKSHGLRRRLFAKGFSKTHVRENFEGVVREKVQLAVNKIFEDGARNDGKVDVFKWWSLMGADIVGCLGFGESFGLLELGAVSFLSFPLRIQTYQL